MRNTRKDELHRKEVKRLEDRISELNYIVQRADAEKDELKEMLSAEKDKNIYLEEKISEMQQEYSLSLEEVKLLKDECKEMLQLMTKQKKEYGKRFKIFMKQLKNKH